MDQAPTPTIGDNMVPPDANPLTERLAEKYRPQLERRDALLKSVDDVPEKITDEATCQRTMVFEAKVKALIKLVDESIRVAEKEPFLNGGRQVDNWFGAITDPLENVEKKLGERILAYQVKKAADEKKKREEAEAKARREAEEAAEKARKAAEKVRGEKSMEKALAAEEAAKEAQAKADAAAEAAQAKTSDLARVRDTTYGVTGSFKMEWTGQITDLEALDLNRLRPYISYAELEKAVVKYAKQTNGQALAGAEIKQLPKGSRR